MNKFIQKLLIILFLMVLATTTVALIACNKQCEVTFDANGGSFENGSTVVQKADKNAKITQPTPPTRSGFTFKWWTKDKKGDYPWNFETDNVTGDITLFAQWERGLVGILSVDGATITGDEIKMTVDKDVNSLSLVDKVTCKEGCTWKLYVDQYGLFEVASKVAPLTNGDNVYYLIVTGADGNTVVTYKLTIYRKYTIMISYYDGSRFLYSEQSITGDEYTADYVPDITGYTFNGWKDAKGNIFVSDTLWTNLALYADKTANEYKVTLDVNGGNELSVTEFQLIYGNSFTLPVPTRTGYSFAGWYAGDMRVTMASGESAIVWNIAQQTQLSARWQANIYTVYLSRNDTNAGSVTGNGAHYYDSSVTITATTNAGYTWVGWFDGDTKLTGEQSYTFTMGLDLSLTAKWSKVNLETNKASAGTVSTLTGKYTVGESVTVTATTNAGYTWVGWYNGEQKLTDSLFYNLTMTDTNVTYTARWSKVSVDCQSAMGEYNGLDGKYVVGDTTTISAVSYLGREFVGWYDGETLLSSQPDYTFELPENDVTYMAIWRAKEEMALFTFISSLNDCLIIGINDKAVTEIVVPDYVTKIAKGAFNGCSKLESITVPFIGTDAQSGTSGYRYPFCIIFDGDEFENCLTVHGYYSGGSMGMCPIPGNLKYVTVTGGDIYYCAFYEFSPLVRVTLPDTLTEIGYRAFYGCTNLAEINIPQSVTAIGDSAFENCSALQSIQLPSGVDTINDSTFENSGLLQIDLSNVKVMRPSAFKNCVGLTTLTIPSGVESIGTGAFSYCNNITTVYWNNSDCLVEGLAFRPCEKLTTVVIGDNVTKIPDRAFMALTALQSVTIPSSVTEIGKIAFFQCASLSQVTLAEGLQVIGTGAFYHCDSLLNITLPDTVTTIGARAFSYSGLKSITIPDKVTEIAETTFMYCHNLAEVEFADSVTLLGRYAFAYCNALTEIHLPSRLTEISGYCFSKSGLVTIEIPAEVVTIGEYAFSECKRLTVLTFATGSKLNSIGERAFADASLSSVELPDGIETVCSKAFYGNGLVSVVIPSSMKIIEGGAFSGNSGLKTVDWYPFNCKLSGGAFSENFSVIFHGQTEIPSYMFAGSSITSYIIPEGITSIGDNAFAGCDKLYSITFPENLVSVGDEAFSGCKALYQVNWNAVALKGTWTMFKGCSVLTKVVFGQKVTAIPSNAFYGCTSLRDVTLSDSVETIGSYAFFGCTGLEEITISANVTRIERYAFAYCSGLKRVTFVNPVGWVAEPTALLDDSRGFGTEELSNAELAAQHLRDTYSTYLWSRKN